jgi:hypothetical protein
VLYHFAAAVLAACVIAGLLGGVCRHIGECIRSHEVFIGQRAGYEQ